jgi:hypothetical protein
MAREEYWMELDELHEGVNRNPSMDRNFERMRGLLGDPETAAQQRRAPRCAARADGSQDAGARDQTTVAFTPAP